jgi:hypothetical protein
MSRKWKIISVLALVLIALQLLRPSIPNKPATAEIQAPPEVKQVLEKGCYSCHSDQAKLAWFDQVVPAYWLVRHDVLTAREHLDFSTLGAKPAAVQKAKLYEAVNMIQLGAMPLPQFAALHPEARLTADDVATLKAYLHPWGALPVQAEAPGSSSAVHGFAPLAAVAPALNGVAFEPAFPEWGLVSITDRGDNNTFRFVLGNDVAMQAIASGKITPWPDGTKFAKVAWKKQLGADGIVRPGDYAQVEFMIKDAGRYKSTDGWGWARWVGPDWKPYGANAEFVNECTSCHQPVRRNDFVYTLPITASHVDGAEIVNNRAALPNGLPYQPFGWRPVTEYVDPKTLTTAALFGNDEAMRAVKAWNASGRSGTPAYGAGSVLALVTWAQRDDPHWFGARVPDLPRTVEFLSIGAQGSPDAYRRFAGSGLNEEHVDAQASLPREGWMRGLTPVELPW